MLHGAPLHWLSQLDGPEEALEGVAMAARAPGPAQRTGHRREPTKMNEENAPAAGPQAALTTSPTYPAPTEPPQPVRFHFGFDRKTLDDKDAAALQQHAEFLAAHPQVQLNINGHADAQGDPRYNQHLAQRRAEYVAELLIEAGAAPNQLKVLGWGADAPAPDAAHPRDNRRVELIYNEAHLATLQGE